MKLNYFFVFLLLLPACLAQLYTNFTDEDFCPYAKGIFMSIITVGGTKEYIKENPFATAACYKEIEEAYEEALDLFVSNMSEVSCNVGLKYSKNDNYLQNYPYFATKAIKEIGTRMKTYYKLMKAAFQTANFVRVENYEDQIVKNIYPEHDLYTRNFKLFEEKKHGENDEIKEIIRKYCKDGTKGLISVAKYFKLCMLKRINETEEYYKSLKEKDITQIKLSEIKL